jgi:primosomal protein N' (replication factor Y) (superfamily II helicase)
MQSFVEVAINLPKISDCFHYHLPPEMSGLVEPGSLVIVPFGAQRVQGVVLRFIRTPDVPGTRPVEEVVDEKPALTPLQIELARWLSEETLSPMGACINLMLPSGLSQLTDTLVRLTPGREIDESSLSPLEKRIVHLLQPEGSLRGRQLEARIRHVEWRGALEKLARDDIVQTRAILPKSNIQPKRVSKVSLVAPVEKIEELEEPLSRYHRVHDRRLKILNYLVNQDAPVEKSQIYEQTDGNNRDLKSLEEADLIQMQEEQVIRDPLEDVTFVPSMPLELTRDQAAAWEKIEPVIKQESRQEAPSAPILLHGVTGSGKTELYLKAVAETLAQGKTAIILVPEISLTPQTVKRFLSRFPGKVGVMHSRLSAGERYDTWRRIRSGELPVVVGPRSALFIPQEKLGLIVVDECHHDSYDQQEGLPLYHGVPTAVELARLSSAVLILGSATPQVTQYYEAVEGYWAYIELPRRILAHRETIAHHARRLGIDLPQQTGEGQTAELKLPEVSVVDMRQELSRGNRSIFSRKLQGAIEHVIETHQQAILFLNRRGSATYVFCRKCGFVVKCPRDDKPLTFHRQPDRLLCHTCGYQRGIPRTCPACGSRQIRQLGTGTEKVEQMVHERFPMARTLRWDAETTREKDAHERILAQFSAHQADILIGTQMLAKGLDLPLVTLVGVILAEVGLNLPDYRATERTFQLLTQVAGRAGRSPLGGRVIFQTYEPENYAIKTAAKHDYQGFYTREIAYRRDLQFPPFNRLVRLEYRHYDPQKAEEAARALAERLLEWVSRDGHRIEVMGPVPCFFSKLSGRYRWQIVLRGRDPTRIVRGQNLPDWILEVDPTSLL